MCARGNRSATGGGVVLPDTSTENYGPTRDWQKKDGTTFKACFDRKGKAEVHFVLTTGKLVVAKLSDLISSDERLATKLEAAAVKNNRKYGEVNPDKRSWIATKNGSDFSYSDERLWYRLTNTQEKEFLIYVKHSSEYIELYDPKNRHFTRLYSDRIEALGTGVVKGWVGIASGGWNGKSVKSKLPNKERPERTLPPVDQTNLKRWTIMDPMGRPDLMTSVLGSFVRMEKGKVHIVNEDGKRSSISFATLSPSDRRFAENFEISAARASKNYGDIDQDRRTWDYVSDESVITYLDERLWSLKPKKKGEMIFLVYASHTADYVELYNPKQQHHFRLFADHVEAHTDWEWLNVGEGNWKLTR